MERKSQNKNTGAVAFGLVSQAAQHAKATGTIPAEATNAALLCESALSWDAGDAPAHARQSYPAVWRGRLDACLDDCASLREVCARDDACARPVVASVRLLAAAAGPAITSDEPGYRAAAARAAARLLHASITQAGPPDAEDASEAFADVGQAADVAAAAAAAAAAATLARATMARRRASRAP